MIHFASNGGGAIPADHLRYLIAYFKAQGLSHDVLDEQIDATKIIPGDAYISCDLGMDTRLRKVREQVFQVQLPHNLTGIKGTDFSVSKANLNILPGARFFKLYDVPQDDPRFVLGGYSKWDVIYGERYAVTQRRQTIATEQGLDPEKPWVIFYPTGPNKILRGNYHKTMGLHAQLSKSLGPHEFILCVHAQAYGHKESRVAVKQMSKQTRRDPSFHLVEGGQTLPFITSCDLFITDIASTLITALSMNKPVVFVAMEQHSTLQRRIHDFQQGLFFNQVSDFGEYIQTYRTSTALARLFDQCIAYDDDQNCRRIAKLILDRYMAWQSR